jgi:sarcosine oxidase subunit beta
VIAGAHGSRGRRTIPAGGVRDVTVVGAGITGLATAFFLAARGFDTLVVERSGVAAGASGVQPGGVRQQWGTCVNCLLARESLAFYRDLDGRLGRRVGARFDACGYVFLAHGTEKLAELGEHVALQNELEIPSRMLSAAEVAHLVPGLDASSVAGAAWNGEDGYFDRPQAVVEGFAAAAVERGARIELGEVRRVERDGGGWRLETSEGVARAGAVVVAAGWESPALLGAELPIGAEPRSLHLSEPIHERLLEPLVVSAERRVAAKQLANGRVLANDLGESGDVVAMRRRLRDLLPILSYVSFPVLTTGMYDVTPDRQPIVGEIDAGLWCAAGFSGHGFMLAPAIARRLAHAVAGEPRDELLSPFAPERFARGHLEHERQLV